MSEKKNFIFYKDRLYELRDVLDCMYKFAINNNKNILLYLKEKFDYQLSHVNIKILQEGLVFQNLDPNFISLSNKYINILQHLHTTKNNFIVRELKEESEVIEIEKLFETLPEIPKTIPKVVVKKKDPLLN
jgi:hypothetical protein